MTRILVTGSAGHLGEALVRTLRARGEEVTGLDILPSAFTDHVGSIADPNFLAPLVRTMDAVLHTATLHKPHIVTHTPRDFVDTNVAGTLELLDASLRGGVSCFVLTSTTSAFGNALRKDPDGSARWITEEVESVPKNIYGTTKKAAEDLGELYYRSRGLPVVILRTSRFFPEVDDNPARRQEFSDPNLKANEYLHRRVDLLDVVEAHIKAIQRAEDIGFGRYIISAPTPFRREDVRRLGHDAPEIVRNYFPEYETIYETRGWSMAPSFDRIYVSRRAKDELGWEPKTGFHEVLRRVKDEEPLLGPLAELIGSKGYHDVDFDDGPYPVEPS